VQVSQCLFHMAVAGFFLYLELDNFEVHGLIDIGSSAINNDDLSPLDDADDTSDVLLRLLRRSEEQGK